MEAKQHSDPRSKYWNVQQTQKSVMRELTRSIRPATNSSNTDTQHESDAMSSEDELTAKQRRNKRKAEKGQWKLDVCKLAVKEIEFNQKVLAISTMYIQSCAYLTFRNQLKRFSVATAS